MDYEKYEDMDTHQLSFVKITDKDLEYNNLTNTSGHEMYGVYDRDMAVYIGNVIYSMIDEMWVYVINPDESSIINAVKLNQLHGFIEILSTKESESMS